MTFNTNLATNAIYSDYYPRSEINQTRLLYPTTSDNGLLAQHYRTLSTDRVIIDYAMESLHNMEFPKSAQRILALCQADYADEDTEPPSVSAILGFVMFIGRVKWLGEPIIGVFSQGTLSVSWDTADQHNLLIEFLNYDKASFALLRPNRKNPTKQVSRAAENLSHDELLKKLEDNGVDQWQI